MLHCPIPDDPIKIDIFLNFLGLFPLKIAVKYFFFFLYIYIYWIPGVLSFQEDLFEVGCVCMEICMKAVHGDRYSNVNDSVGP
jgi:hypothetical protein